MLKLNWYDYSDAYILIKRTISVPNIAAANGDANHTHINVKLKNCAPFNRCVTVINKTQVDTVKGIDVVMPMYNLLKYSTYYSKTSRILYQYYRDELAAGNAGAIVDFTNRVTTDSFKLK